MPLRESTLHLPEHFLMQIGGESHLLLLPETSDIQDIFSTGQALPVAILHILIIFPQGDILLILLIFLIPSLMLPPSSKDFYLFVFN